MGSRQAVFMVGDELSDVAEGRRAGCRIALLCPLTGPRTAPAEEREEVPDLVRSDWAASACWIVPR